MEDRRYTFSPTLLNMQSEDEFYNLYHVKGTFDRILFFLKGF